MTPITPCQDGLFSAAPQGDRGRAVSPPRKLGPDQCGSTSLEWALLLGVIALPSYVVITMALNALVGYYQMLTMLNGMPFP